jgi:DNA-binding NarL/FixJ family response regulator
MPLRILVVDDHDSFRRFVSLALGKRSEFTVIDEVADGLEAVQKAEALQPDVIVLDVRLPGISGFDVARRIRRSCANTRVLFLSQESSAEIIGEALRLGALGYVVKKRAGLDLVAAVDTICHGGQFVPAEFADRTTFEPVQQSQRVTASQGGLPPGVKSEYASRHEVEFYPDDSALLKSLIHFVSTSLKAGHKSVIIGTEAHRKALLQHLDLNSLEFASAVEDGRFISLDATEGLSEFMESSGPNRERFLTVFSKHLQSVDHSANGEQRQVVVFGEMVAVLCARGEARHALQLEMLWNELLQRQLVVLRCGYPNSVTSDEKFYAQICAEHHGRVLTAS